MNPITYIRDKIDAFRIARKDSVRGLEAPRSPKWPGVRRAWLKDHPTCAACGSTTCIEVHHKQPFHLFPALELDPTNFITLCEEPGVEDHLHVGHHGNWKNFNPTVVADAAAMLAESKKT